MMYSLTSLPYFSSMEYLYYYSNSWSRGLNFCSLLYWSLCLTVLYFMGHGLLHNLWLDQFCQCFGPNLLLLLEIVTKSSYNLLSRIQRVCFHKYLFYNSFMGSFLEFIFSNSPIYFLQILFILFFAQFFWGMF